MKNCSARLPDRLTQLGRSTGSVLLKFFFAFEEESGADIWIDSLHVVLGFVAGPDRRGPWEPGRMRPNHTRLVTEGGGIGPRGAGMRRRGGIKGKKDTLLHYYQSESHSSKISFCFLLVRTRNSETTRS